MRTMVVAVVGMVLLVPLVTFYVAANIYLVLIGDWLLKKTSEKCKLFLERTVATLRRTSTAFGLKLSEWGGSRSRLLCLVCLCTISLTTAWNFNQQRDVVQGVAWWLASVMICFLAALLTIPKEFKGWLDSNIPFLNIWMSILFGVVVWLAAAMAGNELNQVFSVPAGLLPKALVALTFAYSVTIVGIFFGICAIFFQLLMFVAAFTKSKKGPFHQLLIIVFCVASFATFFIGFTIGPSPVLSGTAKVYASKIAEEFDFDDKVKCKDFQHGYKYLFLDANRNTVLSILPREHSLTPKEIAVAKRSGKEIETFSESTVRQCIY